MSLLGWLFGMAQAQPIDTGQTVREWIIGQTEAALELTEVGPFATPQGQVAMLDALILARAPNWIDVSKTGGQIVVFHDTTRGQNSKLALIFSDATVADGAEAGGLSVGTGLASIFTPQTFANTNAFFDTFKDGQNAYDTYFFEFDDPEGSERKIVPLPDGTPVPYIHSGWGDGGYPVYVLRDMAGDVIAVYTDFMGINDKGDWLKPPGLRN